MISCELGNIYIYRGKKFLTKKEAIEYRRLLEIIKNEKELNKEWEEEKESRLIKRAWREE